MDNQRLQHTLSLTARGVLEDAAFLFTEEAEGPTDASAWPEGLAQAYIPFAGSSCGHLMLAGSPRLGERLATEMLGADPGSPEVAGQAEDALRELLNMIAGSTLAQVFGTEPWEMGCTELKAVSPEQHLACQSQADVWVHLVTDDEDPVELAAFIERGPL